jgi:hypothetical protein
VIFVVMGRWIPYMEGVEGVVEFVGFGDGEEGVINFLVGAMLVFGLDPLVGFDAAFEEV